MKALSLPLSLSMNWILRGFSSKLGILIKVGRGNDLFKENPFDKCEQPHQKPKPKHVVVDGGPFSTSSKCPQSSAKILKLKN